MKTFACGDVIPGCGARFSAADEDGIFAQVAGHATADHGVTDITETLQRALTRPPAQRFDPVICTDPSGDVLGLLRIEDLASAARSER